MHSLEEEILDIFQEAPATWFLANKVYSILVGQRGLRITQPGAVEECLEGLVEAGYLTSNHFSSPAAYRLNDIQEVVSAALDKMESLCYDKA